jgi:hypothetical protein
MALILALLASAVAQPVSDGPYDLFIGTITVENNTAVLARCDLGNPLYVLHDVAGGHAVADLVRAGPSGGEPIYGEVIGAYRMVDGRNILDVSAINAQQKGKDCHFPPMPPVDAQHMR